MAARDPNPEPAGERALRLRQRQRLIDACISALHIHGPSRTTVEKVVAIAGLSPGTVNFYFDTKAAMLVATLEFLASEFEQRVMVPVERLKDRPVEALERLVALYLDPEIASPRKVSVWYAFWGEASARSEYLEICGKRDESFAVLVRELIERLIVEAAAPHLDADGVALGLIGALEILWQGFAFQEEEAIDRAAARRRCLAYLGSVFPGRFGSAGRPPPRRAGSPYADPERFALERDRLFLPAWQPAGLERAVPKPGDYLTAALLGERILVLRRADGTLGAYRNECRRRPHALTTAARGHLRDGLRCEGDGTLHQESDLDPLEIAAREGLVFVRLAAGAAAPPDPGLDGLAPADAEGEADCAADWKVMVEQWLDGAEEAAPGILADGVAWSAATPAWRRRLVFPGLLIERRPDGASLMRLLPLGPGRCRLCWRHFGAEPDRAAWRRALEARLALAASTQEGLVAPLHRPAAPERPAQRAFAAWLARNGC